MSAPEEWRPVPGLDGLTGYEASSLGRLRRDGRDVNQYPARGYRAFKHGRDKKAVHRFVAAAFHGLPLPGRQVNHKNVRKADNRPENLEWVTAAENTRHAWNTGLNQGAHGRNGRLFSCVICGRDGHSEKRCVTFVQEARS